LRLVVEIDGEVHELQKGMDDKRDSFMKAMGLFIVRFPNTRVENNLDEVVAELGTVCAELLNGKITYPSPDPSPEWGGEDKAHLF
jgi:leucyl-tRNA synthetase